MTQISKNILEDRNGKALNNAKAAFNLNKGLPDYVFTKQWKHFRFCQSDWIFCKEFGDTITTFLDLEQSNTACLLNISRSSSLESDKSEAIFLSKDSTGEKYYNSLRGEGPESGWLYYMEDFVCISDVGDWCMYSERKNEVAVIALNDSGLEKFHLGLELMRAFTLEELCRPGNEGVFPFNRLSPKWHDGLFKNYA